MKSPYFQQFHLPPPLAPAEPDDGSVQLQSILTCPGCRHQRAETMPTDACWYYYDCTGCGRLLQPRLGDCCVFCSFGTVPCPQYQRQELALLQASERPPAKG